MKPTNEELKRSLMVGSIADINNILDPTTEVGKKNKWLLKQLKSGLGGEGVDLVSGGPPCQGFSNADMSVGSLIAWPSLVTHPHLSAPITSGVKYSLTIWFELPLSLQ